LFHVGVREMILIGQIHLLIPKLTISVQKGTRTLFEEDIRNFEAHESVDFQFSGEIGCLHL
jgi:hypothetical protein